MGYTPGPWMWIRRDDDEEPTLASGDVEVCSFGRWGRADAWGEEDTWAGKAPNPVNSALIAAAPELLEQLKMMVYEYIATSAYDASNDAVVIAARAAIAKAEGLS